MPRILLVEDNQDDVDLTLRAFRKHHLENEIEVVRDGEEALLALSRSIPLPEVVLLDLKLPGLDGLEVLRRMRAEQRTRLLPVVVLTTSTEEADIVGSYQLGANSYVQKPISFNDFIAAAGHLGLYWLVLNRNPSIR